MPDVGVTSGVVGVVTPGVGVFGVAVGVTLPSVCPDIGSAVPLEHPSVAKVTNTEPKAITPIDFMTRHI